MEGSSGSTQWRCKRCQGSSATFRTLRSFQRHTREHRETDRIKKELGERYFASRPTTRHQTGVPSEPDQSLEFSRDDGQVRSVKMLCLHPQVHDDKRKHMHTQSQT